MPSSWAQNVQFMHIYISAHLINNTWYNIHNGNTSLFLSLSYRSGSGLAVDINLRSFLKLMFWHHNKKKWNVIKWKRLFIFWHPVVYSHCYCTYIHQGFAHETQWTFGFMLNSGLSNKSVCSSMLFQWICVMIIWSCRAFVYINDSNQT